jgi:DNA/RNA-binding domain of Phe-tRNA-synthetase-like protein
LTETEDLHATSGPIDEQFQESYESPKNQEKNNLMYVDDKKYVVHLNPEQFHESKITQVTGITNEIK